MESYDCYTDYYNTTGQYSTNTANMEKILESTINKDSSSCFSPSDLDENRGSGWEYDSSVQLQSHRQKFMKEKRKNRNNQPTLKQCLFIRMEFYRNGTLDDLIEDPKAMVAIILSAF